jgi:hypothetical protein
MITLLLHLQNVEPIKLDVEEMPSPADTVIVGKNPRDRSDRELDWVEDGVTTIMMPWWRVSYVEVLPSEDRESEFPLPFRND